MTDTAVATPEVGYPVQFIAGKNDPSGKVGEVYAATITQVHEDNNVALIVFFPTGSEPRTNVPIDGTDVYGGPTDDDGNQKKVSVSTFKYIGDK